MLEGATNPTTNMMEEELESAVLNHMFSDSVTAIVKKDSILLQFGLILLRNLGPRRHNNIAQRLKQLAIISRRIATIKNTKQITAFEYIHQRRFN